MTTNRTASAILGDTEVDTKFLENPDFADGLIQGYHEALFHHVQGHTPLRPVPLRTLVEKAAKQHGKSADWAEGLIVGYTIRAQREGWGKDTGEQT